MQPLGRCTLVDGQLSLPLHPWKLNMPWFVPSPPTTLFTHPFPRNPIQCLAPIKSSAHLKSRWLGWLGPISSCHLIHSPFHTDMSQPVLHSHQVLASHQFLTWLGLVCPHLCLTPCLLTLLHPLCLNVRFKVRRARRKTKALRNRKPVSRCRMGSKRVLSVD